MASESPLTPVIGRVASVVETMQPVFAALGGGAALGSILRLAWELQRDDPEFDHAAATGSVWGAVAGAVLLAVDIVRGL
jgi:hypothetical protein